MGKMMILTFNDNEEMAIKRIIAALSDETSFEVIQPNFSPLLSFPGLEIKQHQHRVLQGGEEISLTRLEYSTLVFLASNPGSIFFRKLQITLTTLEWQLSLSMFQTASKICV